MSLYGSYSYEGDGWGLTAGAGASFEGHVEQAPGPDRDEQDFYQAGLNLTFGNFGVGGVFEYFNDFATRSHGSGVGSRHGPRYTMDAWRSARSIRTSTRRGKQFGDADEFRRTASPDRNYAFGPGINLDGEIGYTWVDTDPEGGTVDGTDVDDYNSLEIGIGTNITF